MSNIRIGALRNDQTETEQKIWKKIWIVVDAKDNVKILQSEIQNLILHKKEVLKELKAISPT